MEWRIANFRSGGGHTGRMPRPHETPAPDSASPDPASADPASADAASDAPSSGSDRDLEILVGVDGSGTDVAAVRWAARAATLYGLPLRLLHSAEIPVYGALEDYPGALSGAVLDVLRKQEALEQPAAAAAQRLRQDYPDLELRVTETSGAASAALMEHQDSALLMVVGSGRRGRLGDLLLGTTSLNTAMHAACPVAVINRGIDVDALNHGVVVVGIDGSKGSAAAAWVAFRAAQARGARLVCLSTWYIEVVDGFVVTDPDSPEWQQIEQRQRDLVDRVIAPAREAFPDVQFEVEVVQSASTTVLQDRTNRVDLMVLGTRGRGGFAGKLLGSVSHKVLQAARCPVIVVKSRG